MKHRIITAMTATFLLLGTASAFGDATSVSVTVGPGDDKGAGYGKYEGAKVLTLTITPSSGHKIVSTECTENSGNALWYRSSASDSSHVWKTVGVLPNFDDSESHAAKFKGTLSSTTAGKGGTLAGFDVKVSDVDIDVDALARHADPIWTPTAPSDSRNDLEDKIEDGSSGGLEIPITRSGTSLPATITNTTTATRGKVLRVNINAKKAGTLTFSGMGTKLAIYELSGTTQTKLTSIPNIPVGPFSKILYLHTCEGFSSAVTLTATFTPTGAASSAKDTVRITKQEEGWELFVNTQATTDDYVPVEGCARVPITVTRNPATTSVTLKLKDNSATNPIKFYDAETGGTGATEKVFTMAANASSETFWISGHADGTGSRTITLKKQSGQAWESIDGVDDLTVTVFNVTIAYNYALKQYEHVAATGSQFSLLFTPSTVSAKATLYEWGCDFISPNINTPRFDFTTPSAATTALRDFHWYGHGPAVAGAQFGNIGDSVAEGTTALRWKGNVRRVSVYETWCNVTMCDGGFEVRAPLGKSGSYNGKYFYVDLNHYGSCLGPELKNFEKILMAATDGTWSVTGKGELARNDAVITINTSTLSQFREKAEAHEQKHYDDWQLKENGAFVYRNTDTFFDRVDEMTGTSRMDLLNKIIRDYNTWMPAEHPGPGATGLEWRELRAYAAEYTVAPVGVYERSTAWVEGTYSND